MKKKSLTKKERLDLIKELRKSLEHGKFTVSEIASIRGRIGGLVGAEHPGRRLGGIRGAEARWNKRRRASSKPRVAKTR